jgi:dihydroorotate dehydrogenase
MLFGYANPMLEQDILGIHFKNPIGLSAGFDKNAELTGIIPEVGFGFEEAGTITGEPCEGNPRPRLWRAKKSKSLVVYWGLMNNGSEKIAARLKDKKFRFPVGISIGKTNTESTVELTNGIADYLKAYRAFENIGAYYTINISCPNTFGGEPFTDPAKLDLLLAEINKLPHTKPILIKLDPDLSFEVIDQIIEVARKYKINGFVCSNLTKKRDNPKILDVVPEKGGLSGKVQQDLSDKQVEYIFKKCGKEFLIIGCGGVFTAEDAYRKIKLGASLIYLITGMIFEGPQVVSDINRGLVKLLKIDGYKNISEAIGSDN